MPRPSQKSRALILCLGTLLFGPGFPGLHVHEVEHEGFQEHLEVPHGSHSVEAGETDDCLRSTTLKLSLEGVASTTVGLQALAAAHYTNVVGKELPRPARAPPRHDRSRAPPSFL